MFETTMSPIITSLQEVTWHEITVVAPKPAKYNIFYKVTPDDQVYFGQSMKSKEEITVDECMAALQHIDDAEIYPPVPPDYSLTIAPAHLTDASAFVKRPGLVSYQELKGTSYIPQAVLDETLIMETLFRSPHANIVTYYGCRVQRGRITALFFERLDQTLYQYALTPRFHQLDKARFMQELSSTVAHIHKLGLAHNDLNPSNIMVRDGLPVLIDFGSSQLVGRRIQSLGSPGWYKDKFYTSEKEHDIYALGLLERWLQNPVRPGRESELGL